MGLVVSTTPTYATIGDVRAFPGVPSTLTDDQINDALEPLVEDARPLLLDAFAADGVHRVEFVGAFS